LRDVAKEPRNFFAAKNCNAFKDMIGLHRSCSKRRFGQYRVILMKRSIFCTILATAMLSASAAQAVITITQTLNFNSASSASVSQLLNQYNVAGSALQSVTFLWRPDPTATTATIVSTSGNNRTFTATATLTSSLTSSAFSTISAAQTAGTGTFAVNGKVTVTTPFTTLTPSYTGLNAGLTSSQGTAAFIGSGTVAILNTVALTSFVATPTGGGGNFTATSNAHSGGSLLVTYIGSDVTPLPEPDSWILMLIGFGAIGASMRRRTVHAAG
jgi:hypothetical protein